jgi:hypothetical protein
MLYHVLQMWQLDDAVLFICFVLVTVEALSFRAFNFTQCLVSRAACKISSQPR